MLLGAFPAERDALIAAAAAAIEEAFERPGFAMR